MPSRGKRAAARINSTRAAVLYLSSGVLPVTEEGTNNAVYLADVCLDAGSSAYLINLSNDQGVCAFRVPEDASGVITATKHNWVPAATPFAAGS